MHPDCSSARMLLLVHGHGWQLPAELEEHLEITEKRRLALYSAARQQQASHTACLGRLPSELLKLIAWKSEIEFSWSNCDSEIV